MVFIDPDNPLAVEILQESGEAYFAACRKMVDSLEALRAFDRAVARPVLDSEQIGVGLSCLITPRKGFFSSLYSVMP